MGLLPILIVPGFMSTGLEIQESKLRPEWNGKRLWLNLTSLGMSSIGHDGHDITKRRKSVAEKQQFRKSTAEEIQQLLYKSDWCNHMSLQQDMLTERDGIVVRPIPGK